MNVRLIACRLIACQVLVTRVLNEYSNSIFLKQNYIQKKILFYISDLFLFAESLLFWLYTVSGALCACVCVCVCVCVKGNTSG